MVKTQGVCLWKAAVVILVCCSGFLIPSWHPHPFPPRARCPQQFCAFIPSVVTFFAVLYLFPLVFVFFFIVPLRKIWSLSLSCFFLPRSLCRSRIEEAVATSWRWFYPGFLAVVPKVDHPNHSPNPNAMGWQVLGCCGSWNLSVNSAGLDAVLGKALGCFGRLGMLWLGKTLLIGWEGRLQNTP